MSVASGSLTHALAAACTAHLAALEAQGYARATISARRAHLTRFVEWADARGLTTLTAVTPGVLEAYRAWLHRRRRADTPDGRPLTWATQANALTALRMFFAGAVRAKWLATNPAAGLTLPRLPQRLPRAVLSVEETERVLAEPNLRSALGLRDRAILEVLYSTGIRRMELIGLDVADVDGTRGVVFIREGKGRKDRVVPIGERALRWVERYLERVRPKLIHTRDPGALFVSRRGTRLRPTRLTERLHRYLQAAGVTKPGSVHIFRHTMATLMHDAGADVRDLQAILGHADLATTAIYTRVSIERLKAVHAKTHPAHLTGMSRA